MENLIVIAVIAAIVGVAVFYIYKSQKSGRRCVGCPESGSHCACERNDCGGCAGSRRAK